MKEAEANEFELISIPKIKNNWIISEFNCNIKNIIEWEIECNKK